jgi:hypothetical protein
MLQTRQVVLFEASSRKLPKFKNEGWIEKWFSLLYGRLLLGFVNDRK